MKTLTLFALTAAVLVTSSSAFASRERDCRGSTVEMIQCMGEKIEQQEARIQAETQKIIVSLEANKASEPGFDEAFDLAKKNIEVSNSKAAESIRLQCNAEGVLETAMGSLGRIVTVSCILDLTKQRADRLASLAR